MSSDQTPGELNEAMKNAVMPVTVFVGVEVVVAFFGNLVVLYVFLFRYNKCNFRYFVLCLSLIDITCAVTTMPGEMVTQLYWYVYPVPLICKIKSFFNVFTVSSEAFCLLTIAVDRYRKICHPHGWQISLNVAKWLCLAIYTAGFAISLPVAFYWGTHKELEGNITTTVCEKDQKYNDTDKPFTYSVSIESVIGVCLAGMLVLYILIARTVIFQNRTQRRHEITAREGSALRGNAAWGNAPRAYGLEDETMQDVSSGTNTSSDAGRANSLRARAFNQSVRRKTLIMFILTTTFIVTTILYLTLLSLIAEGVLRNLTEVQRAVYFFFFRLYFINHVINPIVYGVLDPQFRKVMRKVVKKRSLNTYM